MDLGWLVSADIFVIRVLPDIVKSMHLPRPGVGVCLGICQWTETPPSRALKRP